MNWRAAKGSIDTCPPFLIEQKYEDPHTVVEKLYADCFRAKESLILGVFLKGNGMFCGLAEFYGFKDGLHKTCVGYRLMERCRGRGIATEVVALMVDYLFGQTDIEIITASTMVENRASARVLEKNGFCIIILLSPIPFVLPRLPGGCRFQ